MGILTKLFGREDAARRDAREIYAKLMVQSRNPAFYGPARVEDSYDGRIDVLTLHIAGILSALNKHGENGERLGQALFDEMKDDFEIALREEALSDASVKKQITPMIALFYDRVKAYAEALNKEEQSETLIGVFEESLGADSKVFAKSLASYLEHFDQTLKTLTLGQIALAEFEFPSLP